DISERKQAENEISASRERLELVLKTSQEGFWDWDFVTGEIYFSPRYKEILGYRDDELPNHLSTWKKVIFEEDFTQALKMIEDYNAGHLPQFLATQRFYHKNGSIVYILSRAIHLKDQTGKIIRMIGTHKDITPLKKTEEALQQAVLIADTANRSKSEFLASMSHELRTPLNAILGFSQIMSRENALSIDDQKNLNIINQAGEHLLALIDDILEVSKIEAGRSNFNESSFNIRQLLQSLEQMLQLKVLSKGLKLIFQCDIHLPEYVITDQGKLRQVLLNLLGNSIKFTQTGCVMLRVCVIEPPKRQSSDTQTLILRFEIEDTGSGIVPEEMHLLFQPFGQTETGRKSQQGTGLGLKISQKYVQLMGGKITATSILNQGSIFSFNITVGLAEEKSVSSPQLNSQVVGLAPNQLEYRILIAEDVAESRLLLDKILTPIGFSVRQTDNGADTVK
ncbi:MAG: ATP-binding protein, partial [Planktothrix sp.]